MSTSNRIFIDSSVLIEALKGNKVEFYLKLVSDINNENVINAIVITEYLYFVIGFSGGSSPRTLHEKRQVPTLFNANQNLTNVLSDFTFQGGDPSLLETVPQLMIKYNMLPNDAIILATCRIYGITKLASHDSDFILPCTAEGIELLTD